MDGRLGRVLFTSPTAQDDHRDLPGPRTFVRINDLAAPPEPVDGLQGDASV